MSETTIIIGGPQGAGLETSASILTYSLARSGYGVLSDREYFSNIKGRHSYVHMAVSSNRIPRSLTYPVQIVSGMDHETVFTHYKSIVDGGILLYDQSLEEKTLDATASMEEPLRRRLKKEFSERGVDGTLRSLVKYLSETRGVKAVQLSFPEIINQVSRRISLPASQASRYVSSIVVGAVAGLLGLKKEAIEYSLNRRFRDRPEIARHNMTIMDMVYEKVVSEYGPLAALPPPHLREKEVMVVSGNDVVAMAKIVGGLRFQSYYPITPAADESFILESHENIDVDGRTIGSVVVIQTEDEIAAITSAIGAALTGARAATSTSGPGFSLMVEGLGWAGMNEVPVVITYYQRGGPSTGLPTRGSQSDLLFALHSSHGEFPRIVLASGDHVEAFYDAVEAFNLAERYQTPVIHLLDKFLANSIVTLPPPPLGQIRIDRGSVTERVIGDYKRFDTASPISPRAFLGSGTIMWYTGDEHDELGHICEDPEERERMYRKRMEKLDLADREIPAEKRISLYGSLDADLLIVGWGSVKGVALDSLDLLSERGVKAAYLHVRMLSPFPSRAVKEILDEFVEDNVVAVEHSYMAQIADVVTVHCGVKIRKKVVKYTGRPIYRNELVDALTKILSGEDRVILKYGP